MSDEESPILDPAEIVVRRDGPVEPVVTEADRMAEAIVAVLDRLAERIPDLRPLDPEVALRARGARTVSPEFVSSLLAMVDASPGLQELKTGLDRDKARGVLQGRDPYRRIAERLTMLLEAVNHTREAQWAETASAAMATYRMANALAELPENRYLIPHLKILRRHLRRTSGPKRKKTEDLP